MNSVDLDVKNLYFNIKGHEILKDISLAVRSGEFVGIIGPNGSGKSTFLKNVYRVLQPTKGEIFLFGENTKSLSLTQTARQMATVGQFHHVNFDLSVEDMVMMGRIPHQHGIGKISDKDREIVAKSLKAVGLENFANRHFQRLSGGEQQRVVLARALAQQPRFLLLDEATNHLDIHYQLQLMEIVSHLGIGILAVLHDLNLAALYCDYVYALKDGKLVAGGVPKELFTRELVNRIYHVDCDVIHDKQNRPIVIFGRGGSL